MTPGDAHPPSLHHHASWPAAVPRAYTSSCTCVRRAIGPVPAASLVALCSCLHAGSCDLHFHRYVCLLRVGSCALPMPQRSVLPVTLFTP